jgi:hypothetical protein
MACCAVLAWPAQLPSPGAAPAGPAAYVWVFAWKDITAFLAGDLDNVQPRMLVMTFLTTLWGARLTFNVSAAWQGQLCRRSPLRGGTP